jgi:hypothetical protein
VQQKLRKKYKDENRKLTGGKKDKYNWIRENVSNMMVMYDELNEKRQQSYVDLGFCARNHAQQRFSE